MKQFTDLSKKEVKDIKAQKNALKINLAGRSVFLTVM